jgi:hypothetical protein
LEGVSRGEMENAMALASAHEHVAGFA